LSKSIKIFSPSTIANVGSGFDVLGFALDDIGEQMTVTRRSDNQLIIIENQKFNLPVDPDKNVATVAVKSLLEQLGTTVGFSFEFHKNIHPGSGLGTSASSASGAVFAVNELLGKPFSTRELIDFARQGEKMLSGIAHADNVAPNLLGGFALCRGYNPLEVLKLPTPKNLYTAIVHPQTVIYTSDAKKMLNQKISLSSAITQWGNLAGLIVGLYESDYGLIGRSMRDVIVEPIRKKLIPRYDQVKDMALESGAIGCAIAGSGPSIFAFTEGRASAEKIKKSMQEIYLNKEIEANTYVSKIGAEGVRVINKNNG